MKKFGSVPINFKNNFTSYRNNKTLQFILKLKSEYMVTLLLVCIFAGVSVCQKSSISKSAKLFVANEDGGSVSVINLKDKTKNVTIDLSGNKGEMYMAHNVQAAPDGKSVWVTAVPMGSNETEQLLVIDPGSGAIKKRIQLGRHLHIAHVVLDDASKNVFVTAKDSNQVIQLDSITYEIKRRFELGSKSSPHGLRYFNGKLYVANIGSKSLSIVNVTEGRIKNIPLQGMAVQTAVTQDGRSVFVSIYDLREVVKYDLQTGLITRIPLPDGSQGPIQMYATPDSRLLYVCDQGELLQRPVSDKVYVIDIADAKVVGTIKVGNKAHGVVVSRDGNTAYVTNTSDNTVSVIDVATQKVTDTIKVGKSPNGISYWFETGGMP